MVVNKFLTLSVIIPTQNRPNELIRLLDSIRAQKIIPFEIIIVDNGADQLDIKMLLRYRGVLNIKILREPKAGEARARNRGVQSARGDIIAMVDDDCVAGSDWAKNILDSHRHGKFVVQGIGKEHPQSKNIYSYIHNLRSEEGYEYALSLSPASIQVGKTRRPIISLIDTKNISFRRSFTKKIAPWYEDTLPSYAFANDINLVKKLAYFHISIVYNSNVIVYHQGRSTLMTLLMRNFDYGRCDYWAQASLNNQILSTNNTIGLFHNEIKNHTKKSLYKIFLINKKLIQQLIRQSNYSIAERFYGIFVYVLVKIFRVAGHIYEKKYIRS